MSFVDDLRDSGNGWASDDRWVDAAQPDADDLEDRARLVHQDISELVNTSSVDDVHRGWRFFVVRRRADGLLHPPFDWGTTPFPRGWTQAECRPDRAPQHLRGKIDRLFDDEEHIIPGRRCGCGWRVYPDLAAAALGAEHWPDDPDVSLDQEHVVFAGVEFGGKLADRPNIKSRSIDETAVVRARWLRVAGPIYLAPGMPRPVRRGIARRYRVDVVQLERRPFHAVLDGTIADHAAPDGAA